MKFDIDSYREILDTLTRNKSRSFLTGFGVFWGVFMLIVLIGGGQGLKELLQENFSGFATNTAMVWTQATTKPYKGFRKGRYTSMTENDMVRLRQQVPELDIITPVMFGGRKNAVFGDKTFNAHISGYSYDFAKVNSPIIYYGRYINELDVRDSRKVCVIGKQVYKKLFPKGGNPCGQRVRIDSTYYQVIGVDYKGGNGININGRADEQITIPYTVFQKAYNSGDKIHSIAVTGKRGVVMSSLTDRIRTLIARAHLVDPTDEKAVTVFNTEVLFAMVDNLFKGVNYLIWLIGIGTLLAGAIGVSNIMMVTVKERTTEIGIRRAIGATPRMVLTQIISESVLLTAVAGMSGILFGISILEMLELANTTDGILTAHFQVGFWTAIAAAALLSFLGGLAGLAPAWRAMSIKPVDAMRDE
ncbi:MAG: ABC transporter permease [Prevotella sp.]